uniref:hypothetical protein n=1 Tax=Cupriavidus necator TaxID=106590 RepID=UPI003F494EB4
MDSTINREAQRIATDVPMRIHDKADAHTMGLYGHNLLREQDDPSQLIASFTLYERAGNASVVRVQANNIEQPFDIDSSGRLNLGSTVKLRTLVTYLEIITELLARYAGMSRADLAGVQLAKQDVLTRCSSHCPGAFAFSPASLESPSSRSSQKASHLSLN